MQTYQDFLRLVARMRAAQKDYFASRTRSALHDAMQLEKQVDRYLLMALNVRQMTAQQSRIFGEE